jgi:hypothetical protein
LALLGPVAVGGEHIAVLAVDEDGADRHLAAIGGGGGGGQRLFHVGRHRRHPAARPARGQAAAIDTPWSAADRA